MAKYEPKHLGNSSSAEPRLARSGRKGARLAITAATTIAMTSSTLLAPFSAFAENTGKTTAKDAIMSPLATYAGAVAGSVVKTDADKITELKAAIDAAKADEANAKSDYDAAATTYDEKVLARNNAQGAHDAAVSDNNQAEAAARAEYARQLDESTKAASSASTALKDARDKLDAAKTDAEDKSKVLDAAKQAAANAQAKLETAKRRPPTQRRNRSRLPSRPPRMRKLL